MYAQPDLLALFKDCQGVASGVNDALQEFSIPLLCIAEHYQNQGLFNYYATMAALAQFCEYLDPTQIEQHLGVILLHLADDSQPE